MRLLEPLNGLKMAQGHACVHLIFFITMLLIDTDVTINLSKKGADTGDHGAALLADRAIGYRQLHDQLEHMITLSSAAAGEEDDAPTLSPEEIKAEELMIFNLLKWGHLITVGGQIAFILFKTCNLYNLAQFIQCVVVPFGYLPPIFYALFLIKGEYHTWISDVNYVRLWLLVEIVFFFSWLLASIIFVFYAYLVKFKPISKNVKLLENDDNVYNDKKTDDFLRYLKSEYFLMAYIITFILVEVEFGFLGNYHFDNIGTQEFWPVQSTILMFLTYRAFNLLMFSRQMSKGAQIDEDDSHLEGCQKYLKWCEGAFFFILQVAAPVVGFIMYTTNDSFNQYNKLCKIWILTEIVATACEIPYTIMWKLIIKSKNDKLKEAGGLGRSHSINKTKGKKGEPETYEPIPEGDPLQEKRKLVEKLEEMFQSKDDLEYEKDFFSFTVMCYLQENMDQYMITPQKQAQMLYSSLVIAFIVVSMLTCMGYAILTNEAEGYTLVLPSTFPLWFVKFPCAIALHLSLYPEVAKGMNLMQFANNQAELFVAGGSEISFILAFIQVWTALFAETINIWILVTQRDISNCVIYFVALHVIMVVSNMYFDSLMGNKLKKVMDKSPKILFRGNQIKFSKRPAFHKLARIIYKAFRAIYVSVIFYFMPFSVIYLQWFMDPESYNAKFSGGH